MEDPGAAGGVFDHLGRGGVTAAQVAEFECRQALITEFLETPQDRFPWDGALPGWKGGVLVAVVVWIVEMAKAG